MALTITSDYAYWAPNDTSGTTPVLDSNVASFPDMVLDSATGAWVDPGWLTATGTYGGSTGDSTVLKDFMALDTLTTGMIIVAGWVQSPDWEDQTTSDRVMFGYGSLFNNQNGFVFRAIAGDLPWVPTQDAAQWQLRIVSASGDINSSLDLIGCLDGEGPFFCMIVLRNVGGKIAYDVIVDGYQSAATTVTGLDVWSNSEAHLANGISILQRIAGTGGTKNGFLPAGWKVRDFILVRCETDQYMHVNKLASDAYRQDGGIPDSWGDYL